MSISHIEGYCFTPEYCWQSILVKLWNAARAGSPGVAVLHGQAANVVNALPGASTDLVWRLCTAAAWGTTLLGGG